MPINRRIHGVFKNMYDRGLVQWSNACSFVKGINYAVSLQETYQGFSFSLWNVSIEVETIHPMYIFKAVTNADKSAIQWSLFYRSHHSLSQPYTSPFHYSDIVMTAMASQITSLTIVYSTVYSGTDQIKHQSSASLAFVRGIHRGPGTGEFPAQMASNAENVSIWWRHHAYTSPCYFVDDWWQHSSPKHKCFFSAIHSWLTVSYKPCDGSQMI